MNMSTSDDLLAVVRRKLTTEQLKLGMHPDQVPTARLRDAIKHQVLKAYEASLVNAILEYIDRVSGGVYSDSEILAAIRRQQIVCHPLVPANIKGSSIDVTLGGDGFWVANANKRPVYDPRDPAEVERFFVLKQPSKHADYCSSHGLTLMKNIPQSARVIPVYPGERILAHTHEYIGILPPGTTSMQSRSTWGRNGIAACIDAGWGDPGYTTRWTMEIHNFNQEPVLLVVGDRIAQIVFHKTGEVLRPYGGTDSKYHSTNDLAEVMAKWSVEMMLPRAYRDTYVEPLPTNVIPDYRIAQFELEI